MALLSILRLFPTDAGMLTITAFVVISVLIGTAIASISNWRRNRGDVFSDNPHMPPRKTMPLFGPDILILHRPHIGAHPIGGVLALGLAVYLFIALPESRLFMVLAVLLGCMVGLALWFRRK